jgi:hypothetical protein
VQAIIASLAAEADYFCDERGGNATNKRVRMVLSTISGKGWLEGSSRAEPPPPQSADDLDARPRRAGRR